MHNSARRLQTGARTDPPIMKAGFSTAPDARMLELVGQEAQRPAVAWSHRVCMCRAEAA